MANTLTVDERMRLEKERERLYLQLDDKDEEIYQKCQLVEKLKEQLIQHKECIATCQLDNKKLQQELATIQGENKAAKEEAKDAFQSLEELAMDYHEKATEANATAKDMLQLKEISTHQQKKTKEMLTSLLQDLTDIGHAIGIPMEDVKVKEKVDEFTAATLMAVKVKAEVKNLVYVCKTLKTSQMQFNKQASKDDTSVQEALQMQLEDNRVQHYKQVQNSSNLYKTSI